MKKHCTRRDFMRVSGAGVAGLMFGGMACSSPQQQLQEKQQKAPNILLIYIDDLGYGDVSCYGAKRIATPNIDRIAANGLRFSDAHCSSAMCTPSRYTLLTGEYAWRKDNTYIAPGDAPAIITPDRVTLPGVLKSAGYKTGVVGKWHLGLGPESGPDWNVDIKPGPLEIGFDYSFLIPATGDRVPCVYVENHRVVGLDPSDPIKVSFDEPILDEPTGKDHPELLKMRASEDHDNTIVNGVGRIGYMSGGKAARWVDEDMADTITAKAVDFLEQNKDEPFFLYFSTHDIHVPRIPHQRFVGKSGMGARGDATLQLDWCVGQLLDTLERLGLSENTMVIFASDNGPVVDDGYHDQSVEMLGDHKPAGPLRGGKYSSFEGGTRIPLMVSWPGKVAPGVSDAMISQVDLFASLAALVGGEIPAGGAPDSRDALPVLMGKSTEDREYVIEQSDNSTLSIVSEGWKYIEPNDGPAYNASVDIELGNDPEPQLYNLKEDIGEKNNLAAQYPEKVIKLAAMLQKAREGATATAR